MDPHARDSNNDPSANYTNDPNELAHEMEAIDFDHQDYAGIPWDLAINDQPADKFAVQYTDWAEFHAAKQPLNAKCPACSRYWKDAAPTKSTASHYLITGPFINKHSHKQGLNIITCEHHSCAASKLGQITFNQLTAMVQCEELQASSII